MSEYARPDDLGTIMRAVWARLDRLERTSRFRVPVVTDDPAADDLTDGDMWINSTDNALKVRKAGVTKTVTVT